MVTITRLLGKYGPFVYAIGIIIFLLDMLGVPLSWWIYIPFVLFAVIVYLLDVPFYWMDN